MKATWIMTLAAASTLTLFAADGAALAQKYGCMACHNIVGKKSAPAFRGVANRNLRFNGANAKSKIIASIRNGSKGQYPNFTTAMPPYSNIPESDLQVLADWILAQGMTRGGMGRGMGRGMGGGMMQQPPGSGMTPPSSN